MGTHGILEAMWRAFWIKVWVLARFGHRLAYPQPMSGIMSFVVPSPLKFHGDHLDGVILVDSIVFLKGTYEYNCLQDIVDRIYNGSGVAVSAAAIKEASFSGKYKYEDMLHYVLQHSKGPYQFVLVISMGNDIYNEDSADKAMTGIRSFCSTFRNHFDGISLVFGGSAAVWQYSGEKGEKYDRLVNDVLTLANNVTFFWKTRLHGLDYVSSGAHELNTLTKDDIADSMGHLQVRAYPKLESAMVSWLRPLTKLCLGLSRL